MFILDDFRYVLWSIDSRQETMSYNSDAVPNQFILDYKKMRDLELIKNTYVYAWKSEDEVNHPRPTRVRRLYGFGERGGEGMFQLWHSLDWR